MNEQRLSSIAQYLERGPLAETLVYIAFFIYSVVLRRFPLSIEVLRNMFQVMP